MPPHRHHAPLANQPLLHSERKGVPNCGVVSLRHVLNLVKPPVDARYVVFYALADGHDSVENYEESGPNQPPVNPARRNPLTT